MKRWTYTLSVSLGVAGALIVVLAGFAAFNVAGITHVVQADFEPIAVVLPPPPKYPPLDRAAYDTKMEALSMPLSKWRIKQAATTTVATSTATSTVTKRPLWPPQGPYPRDGAILPFNRILAYYGNFYSKKMGILGEFEPAVVLEKLQKEKANWEAADPSTPVKPAIHYIALVAQGSPATEGKYIARMPDAHIEKAISMARQIDGIVFLDLQVGQSTVERELTFIDHFLKEPDVHLGLDPEFAMKGKVKPGTVIGTLDAAGINKTIEHLSAIVREYDLPPKLLMIHRFTYGMVTNARLIRPTPEVQVIMNADGWGSPDLKLKVYGQVVRDEPVQFAGIKIFYKNDTIRAKSRLITPTEVLELKPQPIYVQYQ